MKRAVIENICITAALLGLCVFFELRNNREALLMALAALVALWKHSGRRRKGELGGAGGAALGAGLALVALAGCQADTGGLTAEVGLRVHRPAPAAAAAAAPGALAVGTDALVLTPAASYSCPSGRACLWSSNVDGKLRLVDSAGNSLKQGQATAFITSSNCAGLSSPAEGDVCHDTTLHQPQFFGGATWSTIPTDSLLVHKAGSETITGAKVFNGGATFGASLAMGGFRITGIGAPSAGTDAATKTYCDSAASAAVSYSAVTTALAAGSEAANQVLATPNGSSGGIAPRALVSADIPSLAATKIGSGQLALARGGTGADLSSAAQNQCFCGPVAGGSAAATLRALDGADITAGQVAQARGGTGADLSSSAANRFWASPNGSSGAMAVRALVNADLPASGVTAGTYTSADVTVNAKGIVTGIVNGSGGGGGVTSADLFLSPVTLCAGIGWSTLTADYVGGTKWQALVNMHVTGIRAHTPDASGTFTLKLWRNSSLLATATATITGAGTYTGTFGSSVAITAGDIFTVSARDSGNIDYCNDDASTSFPAVAGPSIRVLKTQLYGSGDVEPTAVSSAYFFGVEPIFTKD